jgi:aldose 1-dehydrogenase [NAD(P)+]
MELSSTKAIKVKPGEKGAALADIEKESLNGSGSVLVKTDYTGICGTDVGIVSGKLTFTYPPKGKSDLVLGHEALGTVEEVDSNVKGLEPGDYVIPMVRRPGGCLQCRTGRQDLCEDADFVEAGIRGKDGFMSEYFIDESRYLIKVPDKSLSRIAVLTEPLKNIVKVYRIYRHSNTGALEHCSDGSFECRNVLVTGFGPIGILFAMIFRTHGFMVTATNGHTDPVRESIAKKTGIELLMDEKRDGSVFTGKKFNAIIDTTGVPSVVINGIKSLNHNGSMMLFGTSSGTATALDADIITMLVEKNCTVFGSVDGFKQDYIMALRYISMWKEMYPGVLESMITSETTPEHALNSLSSKQHGDIKHIINWK